MLTTHIAAYLAAHWGTLLALGLLWLLCVWAAVAETRRFNRIWRDNRGKR